VLLGSSKAKRLLMHRKKPSKLVWTQSWRRLNKKARDDGIVRKKARKAVKVQRAIVGASLEDVSDRWRRMWARPAN
jgi:large subunit ribosomal protein L24e